MRSTFLSLGKSLLSLENVLSSGQQNSKFENFVPQHPEAVVMASNSHCIWAGPDDHGTGYGFNGGDGGRSNCGSGSGGNGGYGCVSGCDSRYNCNKQGHFARDGCGGDGGGR
ncbi:hypothetical protein Sjap_017625 [Stephania japonica]|uniref:Uncharacterized protein n=1 Tax=Stephania japonica TaxID=461633 RepID=A0AAP0I6I9_9MAGN